MLQIARNDNESLARALVTAYNALHRDRVKNDLTFSHYDRVSYPSAPYPYIASTALAVTAANATNLATALVLAIDLHKVLTAHFASDITAAGRYGAGVHAVADTANAIPAVLTTASTQGALNTWLNTTKAAYNLHRSQATVHPSDDIANDVTSADATNEASSVTLVNEIKLDLNNHINSAPTAEMIYLGG